ncbi:PLC-like phosphodiesterase [Mycena crocata]|nr:PLC-like phosphodiesterase [Mycena crocata]
MAVPVNVGNTDSMTVPLLLQRGTQLTKISEKSEKKVVFRVDPDEGQILYASRKHGLVPIETIKEIRTGPDASYYCTQFGYSGDAMDRWITIVYVLNSTYKTLHLLAPTRDVFVLWESTIRKLYTIRVGLMHSLDNTEMRQAVWERQYWKSADKSGDKALSLDEVKSMCVRLNITFPRGDLERLFKEADTKQKKCLNFEEFQHFVKLLKRRPELEALYKRICGDQTFGFAVFEKFMTSTQKSTLTSAEMKIVFERYSTVASPQPAVAPPPIPTPAAPPPPPTISASTGPVSGDAPPPIQSAPSSVPSTATAAVTTGDPAPPAVAPSPAPVPADMPTITSQSSPPPPSAVAPVAASEDPVPPPPLPVVSASSPVSRIMSVESFSSFLGSQDNAPTRLESNDMTQPMSDYFISTSHNTYLVGNQLMGVSTIEGYIRALLCSCRSVEMDIYDGPTEPMVYHGKTLTSQVSAREICEAISKYAFVSSPYPVLLSCEVHCGLAQQDMLVDIMTKTFGSALVKAPLQAQHKIDVLPSPEQLKGRIMIKTKNLYVAAELEAIKAHKKAAEDAAAKAAHLDAELPSSSSESSSESESETAVVMEEINEEISQLKSKWKKLRGKPSSSTSNPTDPKAKKAKVPMSMKLASLLVYTVGVKCRGIGKTEEYAPEQIFSLSENTANKYIKEGVGIEDLIRHTQTHVVRIYPKGTRVQSTNYEPLQYWAAGCQLVALNIQTMDMGYRINQAMFMRCGYQGYVLKPLALRDPHFQELRKHTKHFLDVTIISAQQLPRPKDDSGKEISYDHVPPSDNSGTSATSARTISYSTGAVKDNGFNPMWQEELCLPYDCIGGMKELVFVEFLVKQHKKPDHEPLASYIAPLSSLQSGFRHLPLHDVQLCQHLFSTLFVCLNIRDVA